MFTKIKKLHIEVSTKCNARCPGCPRGWHGSSHIVPGIVETDLSIDHVKNLLSDPALDQLETILFNGDYGDFLMHDDPLEIIRLVREKFPKLRIKIHSNGGGKSVSFWRELAKYNVHVEFGIDGLEDTHSLYRRNTLFSTVIKNASAFVEAGGHAIWMMTVFKHNQHQIEECRSLSKQLNFEQFIYRYSTRGGAEVGVLEVVDDDNRIEYCLENTSEKFKDIPIVFDLYSRKGQEPTQFRKSVLEEKHDNIQEKKLRAERELYWLEKNIDRLTAPMTCRAKQFDEIYITAQGLVYPCCWIGIQRTIENFHHYDEFVDFLGSHKMGVDDISLDNTTVSALLERGYFQKVEDTFNTDRRIRKCAESCTKSSDTNLMFEGVWKQISKS